MAEDTLVAARPALLATGQVVTAIATVMWVDGATGAWIAGIFAAGAAAALATRAGSIRGSLVYACMMLGAVAALQAARVMTESWLPAGPIVMGTLVGRALDQKRPSLLSAPVATLTHLFGVWVASDLR